MRLAALAVAAATLMVLTGCAAPPASVGTQASPPAADAVAPSGQWNGTLVLPGDVRPFDWTVDSASNRLVTTLVVTSSGGPVRTSLDVTRPDGGHDANTITVVPGTPGQRLGSASASPVPPGPYHAELRLDVGQATAYSLTWCTEKPDERTCEVQASAV